MKKILEKSGKSQGISSEEKSGNPDLVTLTGKMGKQPILPIIVPVKKIKGAVC